jgi:mannitol-1-phosphate 5-dehydrogenase
MPKNAVIFGAGLIGRGFIGDICHNSGYHLIFVDVNKPLVKTLNSKKEYPLWLLGEKKEEKKITGLEALHFSRKAKITDKILESEVIFTSVGAKNLNLLSHLLAGGIEKKYRKNKNSYLNIIICENILGGAKIFQKEIPELLDKETLNFFHQRTGFIETVVSRMVSPVSEELLKKYPLLVTVEPYNILPVDKKGFKGKIPEIKGLYPVENIFPYEELKLFVHNLAHACLSYYGYIKGCRYIWESIEDTKIRELLNNVLKETKKALIKKHKFPAVEIDNYIADLIKRFENKALGDTVYRVGRQPIRKLGPEDRLAGAIKLCLSHNVFPENICFVTAACLCYNYQNDAEAVELQKNIKRGGVTFVLKKLCKIDNEKIIKTVKRYYKEIKNESRFVKRYRKPGS